MLTVTKTTTSVTYEAPKQTELTYEVLKTIYLNLVKAGFTNREALIVTRKIDDNARAN